MFLFDSQVQMLPVGDTQRSIEWRQQEDGDSGQWQWLPHYSFPILTLMYINIHNWLDNAQKAKPLVNSGH